MPEHNISLVVWCCDDYLLSDGSIKYRREINELKRDNKQNIALTSDSDVHRILSSATDLFIDVLRTDDEILSINNISRKYRIEPKKIAIVSNNEVAFGIKGYEAIKPNNIMRFVHARQDQKHNTSEPSEVLKYKEKGFKSREEALELLRIICMKYGFFWARHELVDLLGRYDNLKEQTEAYELCKTFSVKDPEMRFKLAGMYKMGIGTDKDMENYMSNLKESMLGGSDKAKYEWIRNVIDNKISHEYKNAIKFMDENNPQLRGLLAKMYKYGYGVDKDIDKAVELMSSSAKDGVGWARNELTDLMIQRNMGDDYEQAFKKCSDFASEGDAWAKGRLARMYYRGIGTNKDVEKAIALMSEAAEGDVKWARNELVEMLKDYVAPKIPKGLYNQLFTDTESAFEEIESILIENPESARNTLEEIEELNKVIRNPAVEAHLIRQRILSKEGPQALNNLINLALGGNKTACDMLGVLYYEGKEIDKNLDFAITYTRLSLKNKTGREVNRLTDLLLERGRNEDFAEAFEICSKSSQGGDAWSTARLGKMYENGKGVEKDIDEAIELFRKASDAGVPWAKDKLKWLLVERNTEQDIKELKRMK